ncbi:hypothetical protein AOLI_G00039340 [Acnodon oligacanthus]
MNGKSSSGTPACIEGLPPLPKSLSGLLNSSGGSWRDMERVYVKKTMIQDDLSRGRANTDGLLANKPANLDAALALLRKEMVSEVGLKPPAAKAGKGQSNSCSCSTKPARSAFRFRHPLLTRCLFALFFLQVGLRQQDMSLLCQLWSLHESIQEYKGSCQDLSAGSSADGPYGMENGYFDEDDEYYTESGVTPTETPDGAELSPQNGTAQGKWLHDSLHVTI